MKSLQVKNVIFGTPMLAVTSILHDSRKYLTTLFFRPWESMTCVDILPLVQANYLTQFKILYAKGVS